MSQNRLLLSNLDSGRLLFPCQLVQLFCGGLQAVHVRAANQRLPVDSHLLPILKEHEGRHRGDAVLNRDLLDVVYIDLGEGEVAWYCRGLCELLVHGRYRFAWATPVCVEVCDDVHGLVEKRLELCGTRNVVDCHVCGWEAELSEGVRSTLFDMGSVALSVESIVMSLKGRAARISALSSAFGSEALSGLLTFAGLRLKWDVLILSRTLGHAQKKD